MQITIAPSFVPVSTANAPTESAAAEQARQVPIPEAAKAADNPALRQGADHYDQAGIAQESEQQKVDEKKQESSAGGQQNDQPDAEAAELHAENAAAAAAGTKETSDEFQSNLQQQLADHFALSAQLADKSGIDKTASGVRDGQSSDTINPVRAKNAAIALNNKLQASGAFQQDDKEASFNRRA